LEEPGRHILRELPITLLPLGVVPCYSRKGVSSEWKGFFELKEIRRQLLEKGRKRDGG
jgi:hypothetical protein